ncbi:DUF1272 domain-containing protein [Metabacillus sediminilitoris]|uniref:DUF1272 domain-containing protein n=1 Tax=Metabacillus sediminilitoris TaxID=2567941 RepID=A0A4V3WG02_9BACI|nr:DUF1272 domain-containing protein [Metabacillus sediminilitoris]QGQ45326.1 DUF1272 domain-containing protein [Metabacillus sediminilitoris]THF82377.1 DUF1272 domain-containing protein [Metabacillus sediminilitoris]
MGLEIKDTCDNCIGNIYGEAYICVHECTFCEGCTLDMFNICPNCNGDLVKGRNQLVFVP